MLANWRQCIALSPQKILHENAVRAQAEKMANEQIARQVEMAKVRNQMYRLLTPEQQAVLNEKHQQRMEQLRDVTNGKKVHR